MDVLTHDRLLEKLTENPPLVIHISCHGGYVGGAFCLAFEDNNGVLE
jgi:hypothetical protein